MDTFWRVALVWHKAKDRTDMLGRAWIAGFIRGMAFMFVVFAVQAYFGHAP